MNKDNLRYEGPLDFKRHRSANYEYTLTCKACGQEFIAARRSAKTCSDACRSALYRKRKASKTDDLPDNAARFLVKLENLVPDAVAPIWKLKEKFGADAALIAAQALHAVATARNISAPTIDRRDGSGKKGSIRRLFRRKV